MDSGWYTPDVQYSLSIFKSFFYCDIQVPFIYLMNTWFKKPLIINIKIKIYYRIRFHESFSFSLAWLYRVIKKSLCTWWVQYRKSQVMFKVSPASFQTFIDTPKCVLEDRAQYSTVHIPNVFCDGHLQIINIFACFFVLQSSGTQRHFDHPLWHSSTP
jgi:hypothetical protein